MCSKFYSTCDKIPDVKTYQICVTSPGIKISLDVSKLSRHLQVTGAFVVQATLLLKVYLQDTKQFSSRTTWHASQLPGCLITMFALLCTSAR